VSASKVRLLTAAVVVVAICGVVLLASIRYSDVSRRPWLPIGIALVAAGGVGLLATCMMWALRSEDRTAQRLSGRRNDPQQHR
jgi:cytochrome c-type biogenesis protein CcmH/NrfG